MRHIFSFNSQVVNVYKQNLVISGRFLRCAVDFSDKQYGQLDY